MLPHLLACELSMTYAVGLQRALQHISEQMLRLCEACPVSDAMQAELNKSFGQGIGRELCSVS